MDFFSRQDRARRRTGFLVVYFTGAVLTIIASVNLVAIGIAEGYSASQSTPERLQGRPVEPSAGLWHPRLIAVSTIATLAVILGGSLYKIAQLSRGGRAVAELMGATPVAPNATDSGHKVLRDVVEEMSIASGVPVPAIYVMSKEPGINAFAAGLTQRDAVVCVTQGCLDQLTRDELQGVIAHEFSHILNGDIRLNLQLVGAIFGILVIGLIGWGLLRASFESDGDRDIRGALVMATVGIALMIIGFVGFFFGRLIQAGVCRQREYLADASAVQFTRQPTGLAGALKKIVARAAVSRVRDSGSEQIAHMFFASSLGRAGGLLATHPPLDRRIRALDAAWDGRFAQLAEPALAPQFAVPSTASDAMVMPFAAAAVTQSIGKAGPRHIQWASDFISAIPPVIDDAAHDPFTARALVFALLMSDEPAVRHKQLDLLGKGTDAPTVQATVKLAGPVAEFGPRGRRVLVDLALPALRQLSGPQCQQFGRAVGELVDADGRVTLFEYMLQRMLAKFLIATPNPARPQIAYYAIKPLAADARVLLSALASADGKDAEAVRSAFAAGVAQLQADVDLKFMPSVGIAALDTALDRLRQAAPGVKRRVVEACAFAVAADGMVQTEEGELLRAIITALDCPLPPLLAEKQPAHQPV